jgi:hypothetical protein
MTKLELLTVMYTLETLLESESNEKALSVIKKIIAEAEATKTKSNNDGA